MKTFYTEWDIADLAKEGVTEIEIDDEVVLTDAAREKAAAMNVTIVPAGRKKARRTARLADGIALQEAEAPQELTAPSSAEFGAGRLVPFGEGDSEQLLQLKSVVLAVLRTEEVSRMFDEFLRRVLVQLRG